MVKNDVPTSSFQTKRINATTFVIREDDLYEEHPLIYAKIHPKAPVLVLTDTGCDQPSEKHKHDKYIHLRDYLEECPIKDNNDKPLNSGGRLQYIIICTHCHYDHIGGIAQFLRGGTTQIIASAAGRDFIESDLETHGQFKYRDRPVPYYHVTKWAQAFERLQYPVESKKPGVDLGISIIHTPGHTPDELAWYDHDEMHLYVGDSFYYEGDDGMPIIWPGDGNLIEWTFSWEKLQRLVITENSRARKNETENDDGWVELPRQVKLSCAHQTTSEDANLMIEDIGNFMFHLLDGNVPVVDRRYMQGEVYKTWRDSVHFDVSAQAPARLMDELADFFDVEGWINPFARAGKC